MKIIKYSPVAVLVIVVIVIGLATTQAGVNVDADKSVNEGEPVSFTASLSGSNDSYSYIWDFGDGSVTGGTLEATHVYADDGEYTATFIVMDRNLFDVNDHPDLAYLLDAGSPEQAIALFVSTLIKEEGGADGIKGLVCADTFTITVNNVAPAVDAGEDQTVNEGALVKITPAFTDKGSGDSHIATVDWGDGTVNTMDPATSPMSDTHAYDDHGVYAVTISVTDDDLGVGTDTLTVEVNKVLLSIPEPTPTPMDIVGGPIMMGGGAGPTSTPTASPTETTDETAPVAGFSGDPLSGDQPLTVNFTSLSTGSITDYLWDFGDGGSSTCQNPSYIYNTAGDFYVSLKVTGPDGSDTETKTYYIHVSDSNPQPTPTESETEPEPTPTDPKPTPTESETEPEPTPTQTDREPGPTDPTEIPEFPTIGLPIAAILSLLYLLERGKD
ncbi:MAG: PKD domain-containing protein [Methanosarcinaceae archaeon]|nr:PKD domain-containing protein [Methanosarcinaceae archaeon]